MPSGVTLRVRAHRERKTVAGSVECSATTASVAPTTVDALALASRCRTPSRARRSATPIRRMRRSNHQPPTASAGAGLHQAAVGQTVRPLVAGIAVVSLDPQPLDRVPLGRGVEALPQVGVLH